MAVGSYLNIFDDTYDERPANAQPDTGPESYLDIFESTYSGKSTESKGVKVARTDYDNPEEEEFDKYAVDAAEETGLPFALIKALGARESGFKREAKAKTSSASGYMQIIDSTAEYLGIDKADPKQNVLGGARYLKEQIDNFGDVELGLTAYFKGPGAVAKYGKNVPGVEGGAEASEYVQDILKRAEAYAEQYGDDMAALKQIGAPESYLSIFENAYEEFNAPEAFNPIAMPKGTDVGEGGEAEPEQGQELNFRQARDELHKELMGEGERMSQRFTALVENGDMDSRAFRENLTPDQLKSLNYYNQMKSTEKATAFTSGVAAGLVPGSGLTQMGTQTTAQENAPVAGAVGRGVGTLAGAVLTSSAIGGLLNKAPVLQQSSLLNTAINRVATSATVSAGQAIGRRDLGQMMGDVAQNAGGGLVSIIPEVVAPAGVAQVIAQPLTDLVYDVAVGKIRDEDIGSKEWWVSEIANLGLSMGFAVKDATSGKVFKDAQKMQRAEIKEIFGNKEAKLELIPQEVDVTTPAEQPKALYKEDKVSSDMTVLMPHDDVIERVRSIASEIPDVDVDRIKGAQGFVAGDTRQEPAVSIRMKDGSVLDGTNLNVPLNASKDDILKIIENKKAEYKTAVPLAPDPSGEQVKLSGDIPEEPDYNAGAQRGSISLKTGESNGKTPQRAAVDRVAKKVWRGLVKTFSADQGAGKDVMLTVETADNYKKYVAWEAKQASDALRNAFNRPQSPEPGRGLSYNEQEKQTVARRINNYLATGEEDISDLPENIQAATRRMTQARKALQQEAISSGVFSGPLAAKIAENDAWLNRSYQKHDQEGWEKIAERRMPNLYNRVTAQVRQELMDYQDNFRQRADNLLGERTQLELRLRDPEIYGAQRDHMEQRVADINNTLNTLDQYLQPVTDERVRGEMSALLSKKSSRRYFDVANGLDSRDLGILKQRSPYLEERPDLRRLMGEYDDPVINYQRSMIKLGSLIANHKMLGEIRELGKTGGWISEGNPVGENYEQFAAEGSERWAPLDGAYMPPEMASALRDFDKVDPAGGLAKKALMVNGLIKAGKTLGNVPGGYLRNFWSWGGIMLNNGHFVINRGGAITRALGKLKDPAEQKKLRLSGVIGQSSRAQEIREALEDLKVGDLDELYDKNLSKTVRRGLRAGKGLMEKAWAMGDEVPKAAMYYLENERYTKAGFSEEEAHEMAAETVRALTPTESRLPKAIRKLRRFTPVGDFVSFAYQRLQNAGALAQQINRELGDSRTRAIGFQRLAGITTNLALSAAVPAATSKLIANMQPDEEKDRRDYVRPWDKTGNLIWLSPTRYLNANYTDPDAALKTFWTEFWRTKDPVHSASAGMKEVLEPFITPGMLFVAMAEATTGATTRGTSLFNVNDNDMQKMGKRLEHILDVAMPSVARTVERMYGGLTGQTNKYGDPFSAKDETMAMAGFRVNTVDVQKQWPFKVFEYKKKFAQARNEEEITKLYNEFYDYVQKGKRIIKREKPDITDTQLERILSNPTVNGEEVYGIGKNLAFEMVRGGNFTPYIRQKVERLNIRGQ